jgi:hypothetical protein
MILIHFPDGTEWFKANWVFRQVLEDVVKTFPDDAELKSALEQAAALGGLFLDSTDLVSAARILRCIRTVTERTVGGQLQGWAGTRPTDTDGQHLYLEAISELLAAVDKQEPKGMHARPAQPEDHDHL